MKILINHSNHPVGKWEEAQRQGWDVIVDLPFPSVSSVSSVEEVEKLVEDNIEKIFEIAKQNEKQDEKASIYLMLQGEFSYCYIMMKKLQEKMREKGVDIKFAIPTTERIVQENEKGEKISKFQFQRWREIDIKPDISKSECKRKIIIHRKVLT